MLMVLLVFIGGLLFFFSPCCWPLYPAYISFLTGSLDSDAHENNADVPVTERKVILPSLGFVLGLSVVFLSLGFTAGKLGIWLATYQAALRKVAGLAIIIAGLSLLGWLPAWLGGREYRMQLPAPPNFMGGFGLGLAFGFGWTPCVGPVLAAILAYVGSTASTTTGIQLLAAYSLGFSVPFLLLAFFFDRLQPVFRRQARAWVALSRASGIMMILLGALVYSDALSAISWSLYYLFF